MRVLEKIGLNIVLIGLITSGQAQIKYWVSFSDKGPEIEDHSPWVSQKTYAQRAMLGLPEWQFTDLPIYSPYIEELEARGGQIITTSRWLNAASVLMDDQVCDLLLELPFIIEVVPQAVGGFVTTLSPEIDSLSMVYALEQIHAEEFIGRGVTGKGVDVGIIDAGFIKAPNNPFLGHAFEGEKVRAWRDWITKNRETPYEGMDSFLDGHGTTVWQMVGGVDTLDNEYSGIATDANYYLARTEHGSMEYRGEQDLWISALEWLDSLGVRLVNCSLGYARGFDDPAENYEPGQMDGQSKIAEGVRIAIEEKGMVVVVSAGNDGNDLTWRYLSTPAEVPGAITVGATNQKVWSKAGYSGIGPEYLPFVKPDVSLFSATGTSFSAPVVTGIIAGMLQLDSTLSPKQVQRVLQMSGHNPLANNFVGYGVPDCKWIYEYLTQEERTLPPNASCSFSTVMNGEKDFAVPMLTAGIDSTEHFIRYHLLEDGRTVHLERAYLPHEWKEEFWIHRPSEGIHQTVIVNPLGRCHSVIWEE